MDEEDGRGVFDRVRRLLPGGREAAARRETLGTDGRETPGNDAESAPPASAPRARVRLQDDRLVKAGFRNPAMVAARPRGEFVAAMADRLSTQDAIEVHRTAVAHEGVVANVLAAAVGGGAPATAAAAYRSVADVACHCDSCLSAVGPAAYLADLLDFALRHLRASVSGPGLRGEYFTDTFTTRHLERIDSTVDFNWGGNAPAPGLPSDGFAVRWTGTLRSAYTEPYEIRVESEGTASGVRLWIGDDQVIGPAGVVGPGVTAQTASMWLNADEPHGIRLEYVNASGAARVRLMWSSWTQPPDVIAQDRLAAVARTVPVTLDGLERRLGQPLRGLFDRCDLVEGRVHRARIATEVMRTLQPPPFASDMDLDLLAEIYEFLLGQLGTSYPELRRTLAMGEPRRTLLLGERLTICDRTDLSPMTRLLLDPSDATSLTEDVIEEIFGYASTSRSPLAADGPGLVVTWRLDVLRRRFLQEDRPSGTAADVRPIIDPDLVGLPDLIDAAPTMSWPRPPERPMDLVEDRRTWLYNQGDQVRQALDDPRAGLPSLITDTFVDTGGVTRQLGLGLGVPMADFQAMLARQRAGEEIDADLLRLQLEAEALEYLGWALDMATKPGGLAGSEKAAVVDIVVEVGKRREFPAWRAAEGALGISLTSAFFRVRDADAPQWVARRFRSTVDLRRVWEQTLRRRILAEQTVRSAWAEAVDDAEGRFRTRQRTFVLDSYWRYGVAPRLTTSQLTDRLQLDLEAGSCQVTTRVEQAIESVQGLLHGARHGLLDLAPDSADETRAVNGLLVLDDNNTFDRVWPWLGGLAPWRAAVRLFLFPEKALRPTLRRDQSEPFQAMVARIRDAGPLDPAAAQREADTYAAFLRDVGSLRFEALARVTPGEAPATAEPWYVIVARGGATGRLYACVQNVRPDSWLQVGFTRSRWHRIPDLEPYAVVLSTVDYRGSDGRCLAGLYVRQPKGSGTAVMFTSYDGTGWSPAREAVDEPFILSARHGGVVPPSPRRATAGAQGWPVAAGDIRVAADLDGDGRTEIVVLALNTDAGQRRAGLLRMVAGGLTLDETADLEATWRLPGGATVILRGAMVNTATRRRERVLVVGDVGGQPAIGLLGLDPDGRPAVLNRLIGTVPGPGGSSWTINTSAMLLAANVTGDPYSELVVVERMAATRHRVTVLRVDDTGFATVGSTEFEASDFLPATYSIDSWPVVLAIGDRDRPQELFVLHAWEPGRVKSHALRWDAASGQLVVAGQMGTDLLLSVEYDPTAESNASFTIVGVFAGSRFQAGQFGFGGEAGREFLMNQPAQWGTYTIVVRLQSPSTPNTYNIPFRTSYVSDGAIAGDAEHRDWNRSHGDVVLVADLDGDGVDEVVLLAPDVHSGAIAGRNAEHGLAVRWNSWGPVTAPGGSTEAIWTIAPGFSYLVGDFDGDGADEIIAADAESITVLRGRRPPRGAYALGVRDRFGPRVHETDLIPMGSPRWRDGREDRIRRSYESSAGPDPLWTSPDLLYLDEAYYFVPVELALRLEEAGYLTAALDWLRAEYDYQQRPGQRIRSHLLAVDSGHESNLVRTAQWLVDPLDTHLIARSRRGAYTRYTILAIVRCLINAGDEEFTYATAESLARAREFYLRALDLMTAPQLAPATPSCADLLGTLTVKVGDDEVRQVWNQIVEELAGLRSLAMMTETVRDLRALAEADLPTAELATRANQRVAAARRADAETDRDVSRYRRDTQAQVTLNERLSTEDYVIEGAAMAARILPSPDGEYWLDDVLQYSLTIPAPRPTFCIPTDPAVAALRRRAELNLRKLRECRNIAGLSMRVEPYELDELPTGPDGLPISTRTYAPMPYRYATIVERARQLVDLARQLEQSMLAALEAGDRAGYDELRARQDLGLARSTVRLRDLQVAQGADGVRAAQIQQQRSLAIANHYQKLIGQGLNDNEKASIGFLVGAAVSQGVSATASIVAAILGKTDEIASQVASASSAAANTLSTTSQIFAANGAFDRRAQEWTYLQDQNRSDARDAQQTIRLARDAAQIAGAERDIAMLQATNAGEVLDFLVFRRFGTAEMYEWMSGLLQQIYRYFLQQATAMAQQAQAQLAFERQETTPAFVRDDYWRPPSDGSARAVVDRRGLTGAERLLRDLTDLDQYAFATLQRKLQLTKTISLASLDAVAFQRFRETGVLPFRTTTELFDRDFPGHYLRLVHRVRTSVIALVPPVNGVHATLSTTGPSRTVAGETFDTVVVRRVPESVALTGTYEASGVFELNAQPELLAPFEGMGIEADWEFRMPRAANAFSFDAVADVLVTIDYTALDSYDHRVDVLRRLDPELAGDRAFVFRNEFADAWYDLRNPDLVEAPAQPMVVSFRTYRTDFPANLDNLSIRNCALAVSRRDGATFELSMASLSYTDGTRTVTTAEMTTVDGLVSSRRSSGAQLLGLQGMSPAGEWTISFAHTDALLATTTRRLFTSGDITDLSLVLTAAGRPPAWPA